ncbi:MAG: hypothetical protein ABSB95_06090 [Dissulfurispiraceae bacterium]|jgi:protein involved in sex pheromone biosynthesis
MVKRTALMILCAFVLIFSGCQKKVEEGMQGIQKAKDVKEQVESKMKEVQQSDKEALEKGEKQSGEPEKSGNSK